jgi:hypothetical protein
MKFQLCLITCEGCKCVFESTIHNLPENLPDISGCKCACHESGRGLVPQRKVTTFRDRKTMKEYIKLKGLKPDEPQSSTP